MGNAQAVFLDISSKIINVYSLPYLTPIASDIPAHIAAPAETAII